MNCDKILKHANKSVFCYLIQHVDLTCGLQIMSTADRDAFERLQSRCAELEDDLARERQLNRSQRRGDDPLQQIDDLVFQYEQRLQILEDEKHGASLPLCWSLHD